MVVTNFEPQYGELDPVPLTFPAGGTVAQLALDQDHYDICYPVDGDMMNRSRAREQHQQTGHMFVWTEDVTRWAQESLRIERLGITGWWVHERHADRMTHAYRRWAEL